MRKHHTRTLASALAALLLLNCTVPAFAGITAQSLDLPMSSDIIDNEDYEYDIFDEDEWDITPSDEVTSRRATFSNVSTASGSNRDLTVITTIDQLEGFFPDENLRDVVFRAVRNGADNCSGTSVEDALANFTGMIKSDGAKLSLEKKIKEVDGIQYLKLADKISLTRHEIRDFTPLSQDTTYYGYPLDTPEDLTEDREATNNVWWQFDGNPFELLPENFGGFLSVDSPADRSYTYEDIEHVLTVVRMKDESFAGDLNIKRCEIEGATADNKSAHVISASVLESEEHLLTVSSFGDSSASLSHILKSGIQTIAVGIDQEIRYWTADDYGTITPGSQSFKYYIRSGFEVYDSVHVTSGGYIGSIVLVKEDSENPAKKLPGAEYLLYKDGTPLDRHTTDSLGQITVLNLEPGSYRFEEIKAPDGYLLDNTSPLEFTIEKHKTTIGGGTESVTTSAGESVTAGDNERFIAGSDSPDITLACTSQTGNAKVTVSYSSLDATPAKDGEPAEKVFDTVAEAESHINEMKNTDRITGRVEVNVEYMETASGAEILTARNTPKPKVPQENATSISGTKTWVDGGKVRKHPDITIVLTQDGKEYARQILRDGEETYHFDKLPVKDDAGQAYVYMVKELSVPNYTSRQDGFHFTNTYKPYTPPGSGGSGGGGGTPPGGSVPPPPGGPGVEPRNPEVPGIPGETDSPKETTPGEPVLPEEPWISESSVTNDPDRTGTPGKLPKTGEMPSLAFWMMLGSIGLALGLKQKEEYKNR